jgi:dienelactone hydrolase
MRSLRLATFAIICCMVAGTASATSTPAPAPTPGQKLVPTIRCEPAVIEADEELAWRLSLTLTNPLAVSLLADSGRAVVEDLGKGETRDARTTVLPLSSLVNAVGTLAPGDSRTLRWTAPATIENGRVSIEIDMHDSTGTSHHLTASAEVEPGPYSKRHPSDVLVVDGRKVEIVYVAPADSSVLPAPGVLLVHGHAHHARQMLRGARALSRAGFAVMLVSQPGYGLSEGPPDFMGPRTMAAASAALDRLARSPGVDSTRLGAWGVSRGATVVTLLMTRRSDVRAAVAQAGIFDMWAAYRGTHFEGIRANMVAEAGPDSSAWQARSAAYSAQRLKGRLLLLHGEDDANAPVTQAKAFYAQLQAFGADVEAEFFPGAEHLLPRDQVAGRAMEFLRAALAPAVGATKH